METDISKRQMKDIQSVFLLWHTHLDSNLEGGEDVKLIGVYSTEEMANKALSRFLNIEGFKHHREGFDISEYRLNQDHWVDGFITT
jgi:hypothetical protein